MWPKQRDGRGGDLEAQRLSGATVVPCLSAGPRLSRFQLANPGLENRQSTETEKASSTTSRPSQALGSQDRCGVQGDGLRRDDDRPESKKVIELARGTSASTGGLVPPLHYQAARQNAAPSPIEARGSCVHLALIRTRRRPNRLVHVRPRICPQRSNHRRKRYRIRTTLNSISGSSEARCSFSAMRAMLENDWRRSCSAAVTGNAVAAPTNAMALISTSRRFISQTSLLFSEISGNTIHRRRRRQNP